MDSREHKRRKDEDGYVTTVEFRNTTGNQVAVCLDAITKVTQLKCTRHGYIYAINTSDGGSRAVLHSPYPWAEFNDYLFDPKRMHRKLGSNAIRRDVHLETVPQGRDEEE